jgi:hypothetical protein
MQFQLRALAYFGRYLPNHATQASAMPFEWHHSGTHQAVLDRGRDTALLNQ